VTRQQIHKTKNDKTIKALDAMRKAHETEVQKDISKFKSEFIKKMQSTRSIKLKWKKSNRRFSFCHKDTL
jgi:hypothetical protein